MMCCKFLLAVVLWSVGHAAVAWAAEKDALHVRSVFTTPQGEVLAVVELPQEITPKAAELHLVFDNKSVATAKEIHGQELDLTVLVDVSGSMKGRPLNDVKAALSALVKQAQARPKDQFELVSFGDEDKVVSGFEKSRQDLTKAIDRLKADNRTTKLYQALYNSVSKPKTGGPERRRVLIVISDGKDEGSDKDMLNNAIKKSKDSGSPIHAVFRGEVGREFEDILVGIGHGTGGSFHPTINEKELTKAILEIYRLEARSFLVSFAYDQDPAAKRTDAAAIELRPPSGSPLSDQIRDAIPAVRIVAPKKDYRIWLFVFSSAVLLIGAIVIWRRKEKPSPIDEVFRDTSEPGPVVVSTPVHEPSGPRHVATQVISYEFPAPQPGQPTARLIGVGGPAEGQQYSMEREIFRIGAGAENDLSIEQDDYVSTQHAYLRYEKGSLFIFDQTSRNGTFVNDNQVGDIGLVLRPGDRIRVGMSIFEVATPSKS